MTGEVFGLAEAARVTGVSVSTLRRRRDDLRKHGASTDSKGGWQIPVHTLLALGLLDKVTADVEPVEPPPVIPPDGGLVTALKTEVEQLRAALADAERRAAVAEARAEERNRVIETQQVAMRLLEAPVSPSRTTYEDLDQWATDTGMSAGKTQVEFIGAHEVVPISRARFWRRRPRPAA